MTVEIGQEDSQVRPLRHTSISDTHTINMLTKTTTRTLNSAIRVATFSKMAAARAQHTLPQLPYAYDVSIANPGTRSAPNAPPYRPWSPASPRRS